MFVENLIDDELVYKAHGIVVKFKKGINIFDNPRITADDLKRHFGTFINIYQSPQCGLDNEVDTNEHTADVGNGDKGVDKEKDAQDEDRVSENNLEVSKDQNSDGAPSEEPNADKKVKEDEKIDEAEEKPDCEKEHKVEDGLNEDDDKKEDKPKTDKTAPKKTGNKNAKKKANK